MSRAAAAWDGSTWTSVPLPSLGLFNFGGELMALNASGVFTLSNDAWVPAGPAAPVQWTYVNRFLGSVDLGDGRGELAYFAYIAPTSYVGASEVMSFNGTAWALEPLGAFTGPINAMARFDVNGQTSLWFGGTFNGVDAQLDPADPYQVDRGVSSNGLARHYFCPISTCPGCPADFDNNGGIDGADLAAFFTDYEQGASCADVDQNGGIDGADLAAFFTFYEAGGC